MTVDLGEDSRLARLGDICLALPEGARRYEGQHAAFSVRGKKFAYYLVDHHGDGRIALTCRVAPDENTALIAADPTRFFMPPYLGPRGWVGYRLDLDEIDWTRVSELVPESYRFAAPKRLLALIGA